MADDDRPIDLNHHATRMAKPARETIEELRDQVDGLLRFKAKCTCGAADRVPSDPVVADQPEPMELIPPWPPDRRALEPGEAF